MIRDPALFNGYVALDPSFYWNDGAVVEQAEAFLARTKVFQADFYAAVAGALGLLIRNGGSPFGIPD